MLSTITSDITGAAPITVQVVPTDVPEMRKANGTGIEVAAQNDNAAPKMHISLFKNDNYEYQLTRYDKKELSSSSHRS